MDKEVQPLISIIVPVYNVEKYLARCLDSLTNQTLRNIEIICVNDGSTDSSLEILRDYASKDNRIIIVDKANGGLSSARNAGLELIQGEYFMFVDSDDWLDECTCEESYKNIKDNDADCLMFSYTKEFGTHSIVNHIFNQDKIVWQNEDVQNNFHRRLFGLIGKELSKPQDGDLIVSACMQLFNSEKFKYIRFVDTKKIGTEDCWYQILVYHNCSKFIYVDRPWYHYLRINTNSLTTRNNPYLFERWQNLYRLMYQYIEANGLSDEYKIALQNRIGISILGLGLNQARSNDSILKGSKHLKLILSSEKFCQALNSLDTKYMPISWKFFFFLAKKRMTISLFSMLKLIEYLRIHKNH